MIKQVRSYWKAQLVLPLGLGLGVVKVRVPRIGARHINVLALTRSWFMAAAALPFAHQKGGLNVDSIGDVL